MIDILELQKETNEYSHKKGYWKNGIELHKKLLLIVSEAVEAMEADRHDNYARLSDESLEYLSNLDDKFFIEYFEEVAKHTFEDELADLIIRTIDLAYETNSKLEQHIILKSRYNKLKTDTSKSY